MTVVSRPVTSSRSCEYIYNMGDNSMRKFVWFGLKEVSETITMEAFACAEVGGVMSAPEVRQHGGNTWTNF